MTTVTHTDLDQIRELGTRYARYADTKQWEKMVGVFTDDAVMRFRNVDGTLANEVTADEFAKTIGGRVGAGRPIHHPFPHEITFISGRPRKVCGPWRTGSTTTARPIPRPPSPSCTASAPTTTRIARSTASGASPTASSPGCG